MRPVATKGLGGLLHPRTAGGARPADPWDYLDRLGQDLQRCRGHAEALRLTLTAVQQLLSADTVFSCSSEGDAHAECIGQVCPSGWCQELVRHLLSEAPGTESQLLRSQLMQPEGAEAFPRTAALVRVSRSRSVWIVALNFGKGRLFQSDDIKMLSLARRMLVNHHQQHRLREGLKGTVLDLIRGFVTAVDMKDSYTSGHSERVARIAVRLGQEMRLAAGVLSDLYVSGLLHDIGKIGIRDEVLWKAGPLTEAEWIHVRTHSLLGEAIVSRVGQLVHLGSGVRGHHERYDGKGYPDGLVGQDIPLLARVLAVADSCDALMSPRPYRPARAPREIEYILAEGAGRQWDPEVVRHFRTCRQELFAICQKGLGDSVSLAAGHLAEVHAEGSWSEANRQDPVGTT